MRPEIATSVLGGFHFHDKSSHFLDEYVMFQKSLNVSDAGIKKNKSAVPSSSKMCFPTKTMALPSKPEGRWYVGADIFSSGE